MLTIPLSMSVCVVVDDDSGIAAEGVPIPGILTTGARGPVNPPFLETINVDEIEDRLTADGMDRLQATANWINLNSFFARGSKILFYHGVSDPWFSASDTVDYYERMAKSSGGLDKVRANSSREGPAARRPSSATS